MCQGLFSEAPRTRHQKSDPEIHKFSWWPERLFIAQRYRNNRLTEHDLANGKSQEFEEDGRTNVVEKMTDKIIELVEDFELVEHTEEFVQN